MLAVNNGIIKALKALKNYSLQNTNLITQNEDSSHEI